MELYHFQVLFVKLRDFGQGLLKDSLYSQILQLDLFAHFREESIFDFQTVNFALDISD